MRVCLKVEVHEQTEMQTVIVTQMIELINSEDFTQVADASNLKKRTSR